MTKIAYELEYMYRDSGNYKFRGYLLIDKPVYIEDIKGLLIDQIYFLPEAIGIMSLCPHPRNDDDHLFHEFVSIREVKSSIPVLSGDEFVTKIKIASSKGWFNVS